ncbi:MAG: metallophosphoesterase [Clostridia bacterium]|nr:metallophosphoesterase [Clostridia bacterium]
MKKESFFTRVPVLFVSLLLAAAGSSMFYAFRMVWVFYDPVLRVIGGAMGVFVITLLVIAVTLLLLALRLFCPEKNGIPLVQSRVCRILGAAAFAMSVLFVVADIAILIFSGSETDVTALLYLKKDLPGILLFFAAVLLLIVLPNLKKRGKAFLSAGLAVCFIAAGLWHIFPCMPYRIVADPVVMDTGADYAVVFATNSPGTGCVHYSFAGVDYTVYAQQNGRRIGDRLIHLVHVPYVHLKNNSYSVESTRVIEDFSYGGRQGKTVRKGPYTLRVNESETQTYLLISDWHTHLKDAKTAISHLGDYDAVLMLGDPAAGMDFEAQAAKYIVQFGGDLTGGELPVLYVRGNHETRGAFAAKMPSYIGYEQLYYTAQRGPYAFLVLDSGEDKPDNHIEYGGMAEYRTERTEMIDWLQNVQVQSDKLIVLTHAWQVSEPEHDLSRAAWDAFSALGARFVISGHTHTCEFLDGDTETEQEYLTAYPGITTYIDGGYNQFTKTYIASKLTLTPQGAHFEAVDQAGSVIQNEVRTW